MSAIKVSNLTKKFKNFTAVSGISFEIGEKRVVGFLGPNGAGKTTTLRMIVGLSKPTLGDIEIDGKKRVFGESGVNSLFGYLPESPSFYSWMTGKEYLEFAYNVFNLPPDKKDARIADLLKLVDLFDAKKKRIGSYSNGMKQRLGIAQALVNDPQILIMDEPVSALDPIGRREVLNIIEELKKSKTIFLSTHILSDVDKICDEVIIINRGKIVANSTISALKEKYAKPILEVEFVSDPDPIIKSVKGEKWVEKLESNGNHLKIWLKGEGVISTNEPLKFFAKQGIGVMKYGLVLPEVEDLFVEMLKEDK